MHTKSVIRRFDRGSSVGKAISQPFRTRKEAVAAIKDMRPALEKSGQGVKNGGQGTLVLTDTDGTYIATIAAEPLEEDIDG